MKILAIIILIILIFIAGRNYGISETAMIIAEMIEESSCLEDLKIKLRKRGLENEE